MQSVYFETNSAPSTFMEKWDVVSGKCSIEDGIVTKLKSNSLNSSVWSFLTSIECYIFLAVFNN